MKKIIPAIIIAFVSGFMFFLYEPIMMYATNMDDFWFDLKIMLKPSINMFAVFFAAVSLFYIIVLLINIIFSKKTYLYKVLVVLGFICFLIFYIQGNFLIGDLPTLDGAEIDWNEYRSGFVSSIILIVSSIIIVTIATCVLKFDKMLNLISFVGIAIFIMLLSSLIPTVMSNNALKEKHHDLAFTENNINQVSKNKNFYIFIADMISSDTFKEVLEDNENKEIFNDFTYFPDTMGAYTVTKYAVPFILSGVWYENDMMLDEYTNQALDQSRLIESLKKDNYSVNIYPEFLRWNTSKTLEIDNCQSTMGISYKDYDECIFKYLKFKYLPYQLKKYSDIETMNFEECRKMNDVDSYNYGNQNYLQILNNNKELEKINDNYFSLIHIEGGHLPFNMDKDVNIIENGTCEQKIEASITIFTKFINRLKENDSYDNSVIIFMADHGYSYPEYHGRQNPILFIKGIDEHHDEMIESDLPVSFDDLQDAYQDLLNDAKSVDLFKNIDLNRKRRFMYSINEDDSYMAEYEQTGTADDLDTLIPTGREYNR